MKTTINKTVLTLTAFMSVNTVFANTLPPSYESPKKDGIAFTATEKTTKTVANSLKPTPEYKGLANSLPPTPEYKGLANSLPPTPEYKGLANSLPPTPDYKGLANSLPPCIEGKALCRQTIDITKAMNTHVNMG